MRRRYSSRRGQRSRLTVPAVFAAAALAVTGGTYLYFDTEADQPSVSTASGTIACPDLTPALDTVPPAAQRVVDEKSAVLDTQITAAFGRLRQSGGASTDVTRILSDLTGQRQQTLAQMESEITRQAGAAPQLRNMAACTVRKEANTEELSVQKGNGQGRTPPQDSGLSVREFADIRQAPAAAGNGRKSGKGSASGSFVVDCGRNQNGHFNSDNVIVAPGVSNGAHHMHDYVGNLSTNAFSVQRTLEASGSTCRNGDKSTHYWPVLRLLDGSRERDANAPGGGKDQNKGKILTPATVTLKFDDATNGQVVAMPPLLNVITGDAKAFTNGRKNARASWSCTGFENRKLDDKYPICPQGSEVVRSLEFPSCWDGKNTVSANHRSHVIFPSADGTCKRGFRAIPRLTQRVTYKIPADAFFAVDTFPEQLHKAVTDHGDFINVMSGGQMDQVVNCVNSGRACTA